MNERNHKADNSEGIMGTLLLKNSDLLYIN